MQEGNSESAAMIQDPVSIMVIDDDPYIDEFLSELLNLQGYNGRWESDSEAALESVLSDPPDLVLLDIRMPGMDGFTLCKALKEDARASHVPVIFISGLYESEDKLKAFEAGGVDYLTKPFSDIEIMARIRTQLNLHRLQVGLEQQVEQRTAELRAEIAERKKVEEALKAKNRELEQFAYSISHDLKTPMITIRGFISRLEQDIAGGGVSDVHDDVQRISAATQRMQQMLEDVLELSRIGRIIDPPEEVSLSTLALEAVAAFEVQISKDKVRVDVDGDMPDVKVDRLRLLQVYHNLIGNALSFMDDQKKPHIEVGSEERDGERVFFVRDNGIGIEPPFHEKVFNLFDRLDPRSKGTGVGLALCKRIVEAHDGRIWVESGGKGNGSTFYFTLKDRPEMS